jgi:hypothetical protein
MSAEVVWTETLYDLVTGGYQRFGQTYHLRFQG